MERMQSIKRALLGMGRTVGKRSIMGQEERIAEVTMKKKISYCCELDNFLPLSVFVTDPAGILISVNKHFMDQLGYDSSDLNNGLNILSLLFSDKEKTEVSDLKNIISSQKMENVYSIATKSGEILQVKIQANSLWDDKIIFGIRGVLTYVEAFEQEQLSSPEKQPEQLDPESQKNGEFASFQSLIGGIAHDFNNLLGIILGNLSMMQLRTNKESPTQKNLTFIESATNEAYNLTKQLLGFSRSGSAQKKIISVSKLLDDTSSLLFHGTDVVVEKKMQKNLWEIPGDSGQLFQLFSNILMNARQAVGNGGEVIITAQNILLKEPKNADLHKGRYLKIVIQDNGIGIPEKHLKQIFDPYFSTKEDGTGLGLSTCSMIIRKYKGHITFKSQVDVGTVCTIYLHAPEIIDAAVIEEQIDKKLYIIGKKILVMDDQEGIRTMLADMLKELGCEVTVSCDGYEAIDKYQFARNEGRPFHTVILDLTVPGGMGGEETFKVLRKIDPAVKVIVTSGYTKSPMIQHASRYGFVGAIKKPYRLEQLSKSLFEVFAKKDSELS